MPTENMMRVFHVDDGENVASYPVRDSHINVAYGECSTVAATAAKAVTITDDPGWKLTTGAIITVHFTYAVPANATLNVAGTGAKSIYLKGAAIGAVILAGDIVTFMYDGAKYIVTAIDRLADDIIHKIDESQKGIAGGVAELDSGGKVPAAQLPSYVDDVLEYSSVSSFPVSGETGKIYVATDTNRSYRWSGSSYFIVSEPNVMTGASSSANGSAGLVPAPNAGDEEKFLAGDGTWTVPQSNYDFTGATGSTAGVHGLVPAPLAGENTKVLMGDGSWQPAPGARVIDVSGTLTNASGSYSGLILDSRISADMKAIRLELSNPSAFQADIEITCGTGSVAISCSNFSGASAYKIYMIKAASDTLTMTSTEFDVLNASKANKADTVLDTTLSRGRKANTDVGTGSFAFGTDVEASNGYSHAEGDNTEASGYASHAEGRLSKAIGFGSHAEGNGTAAGMLAHAEGEDTKALSSGSHAEGYGTIAFDNYSHVDGKNNAIVSSNANSFFANLSEYDSSVTYGFKEFTKETNSSTGVQTLYRSLIANNIGNTPSESPTAWEPARMVDSPLINVTGSGTPAEPKNARALDANGNEYLAGDIFVNCNDDSSGGYSVGQHLKGIEIEANTDLDTLTTPGFYYCVNVATAKTLTHAPCQEGFSMIVMYKNDIGSIQQVVYVQTTIHVRGKTSGGFTTWTYIPRCTMFSPSLNLESTASSAVSNGWFVFYNGGIYIATNDIAIGDENFTSSLSSISGRGGALNILGDRIKDLNSKIEKFDGTPVSTIPFQTGVFYLSANQTIGSIEIPKYTMFICFAYGNNAIGIGVRVTTGATYSITGSAGSWDICKLVASA